jgi:hypothetical protein
MIPTVPATGAPIPIRGTADPADPASVTNRTDAAPQRGQSPALGRMMGNETSSPEVDGSDISIGQRRRLLPPGLPVSL